MSPPLLSSGLGGRGLAEPQAHPPCEQFPWASAGGQALSAGQLWGGRGLAGKGASSPLRASLRLPDSGGCRAPARGDDPGLCSPVRQDLHNNPFKKAVVHIYNGILLSH